MLKAMPGSSADNPHILRRRMPINNEMSVWSLLVLANASLDQRRVFQGREAEADVLANIFQRLRINDPLAIGRIERRPARVICDLEPAPITSRDAIAKASTMIGPHRQMRVAETIIARRRSEEENILLGRLHEIAESL